MEHRETIQLSPYNESNCKRKLCSAPPPNIKSLTSRPTICWAFQHSGIVSCNNIATRRHEQNITSSENEAFHTSDGEKYFPSAPSGKNSVSFIVSELWSVCIKTISFKLGRQSADPSVAIHMSRNNVVVQKWSTIHQSRRNCLSCLVKSFIFYLDIFDLLFSNCETSLIPWESEKSEEIKISEEKNWRWAKENVKEICIIGQGVRFWFKIRRKFLRESWKLKWTRKQSLEK